MFLLLLQVVYQKNRQYYAFFTLVFYVCVHFYFLSLIQFEVMKRRKIQETKNSRHIEDDYDNIRGTKNGLA